MGQVLVPSVIRACELGLLAVGLTMVYGSLKFPNVAHMEFATFGTYCTILLMSALGLALVPAAIISIVVVAIGGFVLYRLVLQRLVRRSVATALIGSFALSIALRALLQALAGSEPLKLQVGVERGVEVLGALVTPMQIRMVLIAVCALAAVLLMLRFTPLGRAIRAVSCNAELAAAAGINSGSVIRAVWLIAGALGALAGLMLGLVTSASIEMGFDLLLPVFAVAVLGGLGSPGGAIIAAFLIAVAENAILKINFGDLVGSGSYLVQPDYAAVVSFVLLVVVLLVRPQGLLGREVRRA